MHQLHILYYEFAQNELKFWYKSLLRLSDMNLNIVFKFLSDVENLRLIGIGLISGI
jgi:hypothetical protein